MTPASLPNWRNEKSPSDQRASVPKMGAILGEGCPEGTVPIRRTRMQDLLRAPSLYLHGKKYEGNGTYAGNYSMLPNNPQAGHHVSHLQFSCHFKGPSTNLEGAWTQYRLLMALKLKRTVTLYFSF